MIGALIENCFDGTALDYYKGSLQLRDALIELNEKHGYVIITYKGLPNDVRRVVGLTHKDDIDNARSIDQEVNASKNKKIIHITFARIPGPYYNALQSGEIAKSDGEKYFNDIPTLNSSRTTAFEHLERLLMAEKKMLYAQKDEY